ncbi:MAG: biopolymer transporter ExbD [bacterium]|nr:biopolymer transporter ExbD [bacterium]
MKPPNDELLTEINITPFVDIILVILIIFLLVAQVMGPQVLGIKLPKATQSDLLPKQPITVFLDTSGRIAVQGVYLDEEEMKRFVREQVAKDPQLEVVISADEKVFHGKVVSILDTIKALGVTKLAIHVQPRL